MNQVELLLLKKGKKQIETTMIIDLVFVFLLIMAIFKGFTKGLIVAVFSLISFVIGLAAALKLSAAFAQYLQNETKLEGRWLPVVAFVIIFIGVAFLVRWAAKLLKGAVNLALLGWVDTLGGIVFYALLYTIILSVVLFSEPSLTSLALKHNRVQQPIPTSPPGAPGWLME